MSRCKANPCCGDPAFCEVPLPQDRTGLVHLNERSQAEAQAQEREPLSSLRAAVTLRADRRRHVSPKTADGHSERRELNRQQELTINAAWHDLVAADGREAQEAILASVYDRGRRDVLNAILSANPAVARRLHDLKEDGTAFDNEEGKLSFDIIVWVTEVAAQLGIEPKEEGIG